MLCDGHLTKLLDLVTDIAGRIMSFSHSTQIPIAMDITTLNHLPRDVVELPSSGDFTGRLESPSKSYTPSRVIID